MAHWTVTYHDEHGTQQTREVDATEKVVELQRWMYFEGIEEAANFVSFVIPTHILEFPFLG